MFDPLAQFKKEEEKKYSDPLAKFKPQPKLNEDNIFVDAPNSASFNPRKINNRPMTEGIDLSPVNVNDYTRPKPTVLSNKGVPVVLGKQADKAASIAGSGVTGFLDSLSLGLISKGMDKLQPGITEDAKRSNPVAFNAGKMGGYLVPGAAVSKALKPALKGIANPVVNRLAEGAIIGGGMTGIEDAVNQKPLNETLKDVGTNIALGGALDLGLYGLGKAIPKAFPKWETTYEGSGMIKNPEGMKFNQTIPTKTTVIDTVERSIPETKTINQQIPKVTTFRNRIADEVKPETLPLENRDFKNVGKRDVKSYQYEHPEIKPFYQQEASILKGELQRTLPASKGANYSNGEYIGYGNQRITSQSIAEIKDTTKASYEEISKALDAIIKDHGTENNALSKKIELILDDRLSNGYSDFYSGENIPKNMDYLYTKSTIGKKYEDIPISKGYEEKPLTLTKNLTIKEETPREVMQNIRKPIKPSIALPQPLKVEPNVITPKIENAPVMANNEAAATLKPSIGATDRTKSISQVVASDADKSKPKFKDVVNNIYTRLVDTNRPLKNVGESTYIKATNSKNVGGTVDYILQNGLVDRSGKKIGESLKDIVKDIPKNEEDTFMNYVLQKHNIDRAREGKPVYADFTPEQSTKAAALIEQQHPEYKVLNDRLVKFIRDFEDEWGNKSGLISDDLWQSLQDTYKNYVPTNRSFDELEQGISKTNGRGFVDQSTPLNKATGSERDIINPVENVMNLVNKTVRTARYNEVGQDLLSAIRSNPEKLKPFAEIVEGEINPNVKNVVSVLEGGKPVNIQVNNKPLLESLQGLYKPNVGEIEGAVKKGTNVFKSLITQKNPVFAIRNIARDIPTAYINGSEANPIKFTRDLLSAGKDLAKNSDIAQQYHGLGGGGANFFNSGNPAQSSRELTKTSIPKKIGNAIEKFNNITESAPRLAEFKRTLNKTGDLQKALYEASDITTNFSRGGDITKHIDSFVPYLNAGVQGLDKLARQFVNKPIPTAAKGLIGITSLTVALDQINKDNPKYQELDNRTKDNYFLIPNGDTFIKIPKSRELGVLFGSLFERTLRASRGEKEAFKDYGNTVATNFSPANPLEANIFSPALGLKSNKDFANRDIVPRAMIEDNRSKYLQYDEKTSEITKKIAEETHKVGVDLSPKQMDYLIKSYTGVIGQLGLPATTKSTMSGNALQKAVKPVTTQFIADPLYNNQTIGNFYDNYDKIKNKAADKNILEKIPSKTVTSEEKLKSVFTKASSSMSDINKEIRKAETNGEDEKVKKLREQLIEVAKKANSIYSSK